MLGILERIPKLKHRRTYRKAYHGRRRFKAVPSKASMSLAVYVEAEESLFCDNCATHIGVGIGYCMDNAGNTLCLKCAVRKEQ